MQQHRGIPAPVAINVDALDEAKKIKVGGLEFAEKFLGHALDIERGFHPVGKLGEGESPTFVQFVDVHDDAGDFRDKQVAGLPFDVKVFARVALGTVALDPQPQALAGVLVMIGGTVEKNNQVLVGDFR